MTDRRTLLAGAGAMLASCLVASRSARAADPILTLRGVSDQAGRAGEVRSSLADLDALPQTAFATTTPWHQDATRFSGVTLGSYLSAMGARPRRVRLVALNDYVVEAEADFLLGGGALLATRQDGQPMPVSGKGPVFILFPFDSRSELRHLAYYSRSVWQLSAIEILP